MSGLDRVEHLPPISPEAQATLASFEQAEAVEIDSLVVYGELGIYCYPTPNGAVVLSQTCDLVQSSKLTAQLAPLVRLGEVDAKEARDGKRPQYVHVHALGMDAFADLSIVATIAKETLASLRRIPGSHAVVDGEVRTFGRAVGRKFSRFPFPDEVTPWLRPLQRVIQSKSQKPNSDLGKTLADVTGLRLEAVNGWTAAPPYNLTLIVIVKPGTIPALPEDDQEVTDLSASPMFDGTDSPSVIAARIQREQDPGTRALLWAAFGEALAALCRPGDSEPISVRGSVSSFTAEVVSEDELTYDRVLRTEEIDLDHLSPPAPR